MKYFLWKGLVLYRVVIDCYTKAVFYILCCFVLKKEKKLKLGDGPLFE